jgi:outer membrane protein assembly factor BamD (BamD/ComL family)
MLARARSLRGQGELAEAGRIYAALIDQRPDSTEANAARVSLGQLRLGSGKAKAALALFDDYLRRGGPLAEEALWGKIQALDALGRTSALAATVQALEHRFPRSAYLARAKERLQP